MSKGLLQTGQAVLLGSIVMTLFLALKVSTAGTEMAIGVIETALALVVFALFLEFLRIFRRRKDIEKPLAEILIALDGIDPETGLVRPIEPLKEGELVPLTQRINGMLGSFGSTLKEVREEKEEIHALNEELEASLEQLIAAEQEVTRQKMFFEALFHNTPDAVVLVDENHLVRDMNAEFVKLFGYQLEEIEGKELDGIIAGSRMEEANSLTKSLLGGTEVNIESIRYGKGERPIEVTVKGVPILYQNWSNGGYAIYSDIGPRKNQERRMQFLGNHDYLTGLFNRRCFEEQINRLDKEYSGMAAIIIADVNGLKLTNDAFGEDIGDAMLKAFGDILLDECGSDQLVARMGGDDFAVYLPDINAQQAEQIVRRIKSRCQGVRIGDIALSVSFGYAERELPGGKITETLKMAEIFMNRHKLSEGSSARGKTIGTIIKTLNEKNSREEQHSQRVSVLSRALGEAMGLDERQQRDLKTMGLLHDVGKIAIDENILNKSGNLTAEEYAEMKRHPEIGYRILSSVNDLAELAEYVLAHHERWDGNGYPKGLKGEEIPYLSRIITVVDAYDAMTRERAYRAAMPDDYAVGELRANAGTQFDPAIVEVFLNRPDVRFYDQEQPDKTR